MNYHKKKENEILLFKNITLTADISINVNYTEKLNKFIKKLKQKEQQMRF